MYSQMPGYITIPVYMYMYIYRERSQNRPFTMLDFRHLTVNRTAVNFPRWAFKLLILRKDGQTFLENDQYSDCV